MLINLGAFIIFLTMVWISNNIELIIHKSLTHPIPVINHFSFVLKIRNHFNIPLKIANSGRRNQYGIEFRKRNRWNTFTNKSAGRVMFESLIGITSEEKNWKQYFCPNNAHSLLFIHVDITNPFILFGEKNFFFFGIELLKIDSFKIMIKTWVD